MSFDQNKLDFYISQEVNVLFRGKHGVGKTAMVKEAFEKAGLDWRYYSAATMDPWVDFIGIPKEQTDEAGNSHIGLVLPKGLHEVEALFMDELNRAPKKVRNAVMELIQFRSINGTPFPNLKFIWAAINPDDEEAADTSYDVEALDPAQKDRFEVIVDIPYMPVKSFFERRYGEAGAGAVEWWKGLKSEQKDLVSPRRLEYAIKFYNAGGDLRDIMPNDQLNLTQLRQRLSTGTVKKRLEELRASTDDEARRLAFGNISFATDAVPMIMKSDDYINAFIEYLPRDIVSGLITDKEGADADRIISNSPPEAISPILASLVGGGNIKRSTLQKITESAEANNIDLSSEDSHREHVEQGLRSVALSQTDRYTALHAIQANYNKKASPEIYEMTLELITKIIYHTTDKGLNDQKKPFSQLSRHILALLQDSFGPDSNVMQKWAENKERWYSGTDAARLDRIEGYLTEFLKKKSN